MRWHTNTVGHHEEQGGALPVGMKMGKYLRLAGELWQFLRVRKKWWLGPILVVLVLFSVLILLTEGSALAPFIYALF